MPSVLAMAAYAPSDIWLASAMRIRSTTSVASVTTIASLANTRLESISAGEAVCEEEVLGQAARGTGKSGSALLATETICREGERPPAAGWDHMIIQPS